MIYLIAAMGIILFLSIGFFFISTNEQTITPNDVHTVQKHFVAGKTFETTSSIFVDGDYSGR